MNMMCCLLCYRCNDSHGHLFFECEFSASVWKTISLKIGMEQVGSRWDDIIEWLKQRAKSSTITNVLGRLLVAASAYFIWQERNNRMFNNQNRSSNVLLNVIMDTVRYRLRGLRFKKTTRVLKTLDEWNIREGAIFDDGG
jgi:hypothetical protein